MRQLLLTASLAAATLTLVHAAAARAQASSVIETPTLTIELIGLKRWTVAMIDDSLAKYSPKDRLTAHACAAILRTKLHQRLRSRVAEGQPVAPDPGGESRQDTVTQRGVSRAK